MNLIKRKFIDCHLIINNKNAPFIEIYDWGFVRLKSDLVSEVVEYDLEFMYKTFVGKSFPTDALMESFVSFAFGRKLLLLENKRGNLKNNFNKIKLEKIIMNNGNEYYIII
jgi:hypothetical protein